MSLSRVSTLTSCSEEDDASAKKKPLLLGEVQQDSSSLERRDELEVRRERRASFVDGWPGSRAVKHTA